MHSVYHDFLRLNAVQFFGTWLSQLNANRNHKIYSKSYIIKILYIIYRYIKTANGMLQHKTIILSSEQPQSEGHYVEGKYAQHDQQSE